MRFILLCIIRRVLFCLIVAVMLTCAVNGQDRVGRAFDAVPQPTRARLVNRLSDYVEYEKTGQYAKLYELLYRPNEAGDNGTSKETYTVSRQEAGRQHATLQEFSPASVIDLTLNDGDPPTYSITGSAKVKCGVEIVEKEMTIYAKFQNGDWYFSEALDSHWHID